ncbi:enoyl-CoA hydratase/isomerase family protein [Tomitella gaofuii]|uniref:enoyl-CoA hydratase/isomerase family protein n=1 Tax=Tomitella gaofuii TaxID=2760083 RepID=UPI0015F870CD|nr:enoyl-CoA hydratase/isomerase family protein [Tomitella gaofuii]
MTDTATPTEQTWSEILVDSVEPGIVVLTMNRPQRLNALAAGMLEEMRVALRALDADPAVRVVILTGAGPGFCAGADVKSASENPREPDPDANPVAITFASQERIASLHELIHRMRTPVIAAVNGVTVGGGFSLALACDVRYAARSARFGSVFITQGVSSCDMGTSYLLPKIVGVSRAAELMLTGRVFECDEAQEMGLVQGVVADGEVVERACVTARQIAANPPMGVWMTKETLWQNIDAPSYRHALDMENRTQVMCSFSGEIEAAFRAFADRAEPHWKHL